MKLAISLLIPTIIDFFTYYFSKKKDREAELRKEKLRCYKDFSSCLARTMEGESTSKDQIAYHHVATQLNLVASSSVICVLNEFMRVTAEPVKKRSKEHYIKVQSNLFRNIRLDLGLKDNGVDQDFFLWSSGIKSELSTNKSERAGPVCNNSVFFITQKCVALACR
ncbi:hypothetical protein MNBD_GAMMA17-1425 [hydrothermal vent metagenome]|uniref:Uncharacterized protein n=1 Tax=hydrothermal vent metagenome TaxID=652676 RepID=A0A3B0ZCH3_9ZZZZ